MARTNTKSKSGGSKTSSSNKGSGSTSGRSASSARSTSRSSSNGSTASGRSSGSSKTSSGTSNEGLLKLFTEQLQDVYYVEKQLLRGLKRMAKVAQNEDLRTAFEEHREQTENQMERLEEVFDMLDRDPKGKKCEAMDGLLEEAKDLMEDFADDPALDAALVAAAQKVEHYEIATYGSLCAWAEQLGLEEAVPLLEETLQEEKDTDQQLTDLAMSVLNEQAEEDDQKVETATAGGRSRSKSR